ncbi:MAG: ribonuclease P protein component [Pseudomonadota bacterium]
MADNTFTKADRILKRPEFIQLSNTGNRVYNRHYIAVYKIGFAQDRSRLGITVTKKVGSAVNRNRIKRYIREYFRRNKDSIQKKMDINIIAKKTVTDLTQEESYISLRNIFDRLSAQM